MPGAPPALVVEPLVVLLADVALATVTLAVVTATLLLATVSPLTVVPVAVLVIPVPVVPPGVPELVLMPLPAPESSSDEHPPEPIAASTIGNAVAIERPREDRVRGVMMSFP